MARPGSEAPPSRDPIAPVDPLERLRAAVRGRGARIVLAELGDERVVLAARLAREREICLPLDVNDGSLAAARSEAAAHLESRLLARQIPAAEIRLRLADPLHVAAALVATGAADGAVLGAIATTAATLRAALDAVGPAPGVSRVSSCFLMTPPNAGSWLFADCAVNPDPSPAELADIAVATAASCRTLLGEEPRVALLSFSTYGSATHPRVDKIRAAVAELERRQVDFEFDGELQADAALDEAVAERKAGARGRSAGVAGRANVLIFPDLDAGNIAYKLVQRFSGARALGPLLQGLAAPVHDLSRGCSSEEIVDVMTVAAAAAGGALARKGVRP